MKTSRPAAVAGLFYPGSALQLGEAVRALLSEVEPQPPLVPKALIAPHAGYVYSGPVAASAYAALSAIASRVRRVVLIGPAHRVALRGLALPAADAFDTPLGTVRLDRAACASLTDLSQVSVNSLAHAAEHSLEVHLPFLQAVLDEFTLVPLVAGLASPAAVAEVLERLWSGDETLIVVSSDLSHYLGYEAARRQDRSTVEEILALREPLSQDQACGGMAINGLVLAARRHGLLPHLLDLRNSGDTQGSRDRVVGYAALAFTQENRA